MAETKEVNLSQAIRDALRLKGHTDTSRAMNSEIREWIVSSYPHLKDKVSTPAFSSTLNQQRKKFEDGGGEPTAEVAVSAPGVPVAASQAPNPAESLALLTTTLAQLKTLSAKVGGAAVLKRLCDLL